MHGGDSASGLGRARMSARRHILSIKLCLELASPKREFAQLKFTPSRPKPSGKWWSLKRSPCIRICWAQICDINYRPFIFRNKGSPVFSFFFNHGLLEMVIWNGVELINGHFSWEVSTKLYNFHVFFSISKLLSILKCWIAKIGSGNVRVDWSE